jgi:hypothetical protein
MGKRDRSLLGRPIWLDCPEDETYRRLVAHERELERLTTRHKRVTFAAYVAAAGAVALSIWAVAS